MTPFRWTSLWLPLIALFVAAPASASEYHDAPREVGIAVDRPGTAADVITGCLMAAATAYHLPAPMLVILLNVEGGRPGRVSGNTNGTVDIGPMQVNEIWLPEIARHWHAPVAQSFLALRDNFCANVEAGAFILRQALDEAHGDFWTGVGYYHSHDPGYRAAYLRRVLDQALRLQASATRSTSRQHLASEGPLPSPLSVRGY